LPRYGRPPQQEHREWWHDEPVLGEHPLAVTPVPLGLSYATWHGVFAVNNRHAAMNFSFSSQKAHYTSLLFFTGLHYWCWTATCSANLTSSTINTRLVCKGRYHVLSRVPTRCSYRKQLLVLSACAPWELCEATCFHLTAPHNMLILILLPLYTYIYTHIWKLFNINILKLKVIFT
jgi:hypothetical protein